MGKKKISKNQRTDRKGKKNEHVKILFPVDTGRGIAFKEKLIKLDEVNNLLNQLKQQ